MRVLLLRPASPNERFGLGPFFRVEPLGLAYVAAALRARGHDVHLFDLRFPPSLARVLAKVRPDIVGIASLHTVDTHAALHVARSVKAFDRRIFTVIGGHAASVYPRPVETPDVDAIALGDGELAMAELVDALARGARPDKLAGFLLPDGKGTFAGEPETSRVSLDLVPLPARDLLAKHQHRYMCVHKSPLWALETARGCPFRCSFCSVWRHTERSYRLRNIDAVCEDFARVGDNIFIVDDLFWYPRTRSLELAKELRRRGIRKDWILVQSRLDTVARSAELLEAWRPIAREFDIFFGFEAATKERLDELDKDLSVDATEEGVRVARHYEYGVTGNFVVDPDWGEADFHAMWALVDRLGLRRAGYTILTPLPGTPFFERMKSRIVEQDWAKFDMHHILYEPALGRDRFFELFVESWRRNVLSPRYAKTRWWRWLRGLTAKQMVMLARVLWQTQTLLSVDAYKRDAFAQQLPAALADPTVDLPLRS